MVSYHPNPLPMYSKNHVNSMAYPPPPSWFTNSYPPPSHHSSNMQYLSGSSAGTDSDASAAYYNQYHHHILHPASSDWTPHDGFQSVNSTNMPTMMVPSAPVSTQMHHNHIREENDSVINVQPSPPLTIHSVCSEMSSPISRVPSGSNHTTNDDCSPKSSDPLRSANNRSPYQWMKKPLYNNQPQPGKTRTKDKYRVVYTDYQRLELEKEFITARYITIRRKTELAQMLQLSERQVKIWFQNRRAKERKNSKKRDGCDERNMNIMNGGMTNVGYEIKTKLEPGLIPPAHSAYGTPFHHSHSHPHMSHPMHPMVSMTSMSSMGGMGVGPMGGMGVGPMGGMAAMGGMGSMSNMGLHMHMHPSPVEILTEPPLNSTGSSQN